MSRRILLTVVAGLSLLSLQSFPTDSFQETLTVRIEALDVRHFPQVLVAVTVLDQAGRPVTDLPPEAFQVSADNQPLPISTVASATDEGQGIAVVLAFDVSGSMVGQPLAQAKEAGKALVAQLGPADRIAVLAFASEVRVVQPLTPDRDALTRAIDSLPLGGNTALYEAVARSVEEAARSDLPRRAVVLLSDGQDYGNLSTLDRDASLAAARAAGAPFFVVGLGNLVDQPYLDELASGSRGRLLLAPAPELLGGLYKDIGAILRHQYVLTIDAASLSAAGAARLRIAVSHNGAAGAAEAPLDVPAPPATPAPRPQDTRPAPVGAEPEAPVERPAEEGEGGLGPTVALVGLFAAAVVAALAGAALWWRRRRRPAAASEYSGPRHPAGAAAAPAPVQSPQHDVQPQPAQASLQLLTPANGRAYPVGDSPVTIGFTPDCSICLPGGLPGRWEQARVWRRDGRYMLHNLSRFGSVSVDGRPVVWVVLEDGDEIQMGQHRLLFRLIPSAEDCAENSNSFL